MSEKLDRLVASAQEVIRQNAGLRVNGKGASNRTQEISEQVITECCRRLHRLGFYLVNVDGMQKKHIDALVGSWYAQPMAPKTIQNLFSRVKIFCGWLEKSGIVSPLGAIGHLPGVDPAELKVKTYTEKSVSWSGCGVDVCKKIDEALLEDFRHGTMLRMSLAFGLRKKEDIKIKLWRADKGDRLEVDGSVAKNGKFRSIPIDINTAYGKMQRWCLDEAKKICKKYDALGWPGLTYKQNENRYYHFNRKLGITKLDLGVVGHGLRAEFFENQAMLRGMLPVCLGGARDQLDKQTIERINLEISQLGGHDDPHTISAYYGSLRKLPKADGRGERVGGVTVDGAVDLIAGIYVNPPVIMDKGGSYRIKSVAEREQTVVTIVTEQIGVVPESLCLLDFLSVHPAMAVKIRDLLVRVGL